MKDYYHLIEELRDSEIIADGYVEMVDVLFGVVDGYKEYQEEAAQGHG